MSALPVPERFPAFTFAFQPIVDAAARRTVSWETLLRSPLGEPAAFVLDQVSAEHLHCFDEQLRPKAIASACRLGIDCDLNLNFLPQSLFTSPTALASTIEAAEEYRFSPDRIVLEVSESEVIDDPASFVRAINEYRGLGLRVAIDDFGAGHSGLNLLADFQPD